MAQYLLAVRYADRKFPPEEFRRLCVDVPAFDAKLEDAGAFVFHGGLLSPESATVVRQSGDDFLITDGPYTETKEHLGGFWIIDDVEVGQRFAAHIRVAFGVSDTAGATVIAGPAPTPWQSLNARLEGPAGLQLTLFSDLPHPGTTTQPPTVEGRPARRGSRQSEVCAPVGPVPARDTPGILPSPDIFRR